MLNNLSLLASQTSLLIENSLQQAMLNSNWNELQHTLDSIGENDKPLAQSGYCKICLDVGHLLLGQESVMAAIKRYFSEIREIHLHGIKNHMDHYSLALLPQERLARWMKHLIRNQYDGIINLEVFSPRDLMVSLELLGRTPHSRFRGLSEP